MNIARQQTQAYLGARLRIRRAAGKLVIAVPGAGVLRVGGKSVRVDEAGACPRQGAQGSGDRPLHGRRRGAHRAPGAGPVAMHVEIWSDIACPWCYVGKRCFEVALDSFEGRDDVTVTYRAFELDPDAPAEREGPAVEQLARKYGISVDRAAELNGQLTAVAATVGLDMRFDQVRMGNTLDAHRVVKLAGEHGVAAAVKERLFQAYFTEGELLSDRDDPGAARRGVRRPGSRDARHARKRPLHGRRPPGRAARRHQRISAVPFFAVDRKVGAAGAQDPKVLLDMLREVARRDDATARTS